MQATDASVPRVGIVMGSDSDWPKIKAAAAALAEFGVPYEVRVMSAHRTPEVVGQYARSARQRGLQVIIAAAGGAAHLAGVVAAHTTLPVIGLPVPTPDLGGLDSLLSTVQMPGDVPVASMAVGMGGPRNAGLFAVQILATADERLQARLAQFKQQLAAKIAASDARLQEQRAADDAAAR
jgi:5-(carboxyamino)imidazole ribonucleotide mutase